MLCIITCLQKLVALQNTFSNQNMLVGSTASHFLEHVQDKEPTTPTDKKEDAEVQCMDDAGPDNRPQSLSSISLAVTLGNLFIQIYQI